MMYSLNAQKTAEKGFALVVTLSLMILLTVIAVGLLTLSTISLRSSAQGSAMAEARANARLALMVALGELQKEMGPDMRISTESALLDTNPNTEAIDGVGHARWLGSYNSWGNWLNAEYTLPSGGQPLNIASTYTAGRENMFRRWLLSLPAGDETRINSPKSTIDPKDPEWVDMVGEGSLGQNPKAGDATRAYLTTVGKTGKYAWWIGPENHKAKITLTGQPRTTLTAARWQESQGDTGEVGIGALAGFEKLDKDTTGIGKKLISTNSLSLGLVETDDQVTEQAKKTTQKHFFDLTANSQGVIASVRTGHLKKDLSLLFEITDDDLPAPYKFNQGTVNQEPSIRPMSPDLLANSPKITERHFASWTNMRHYYRMYRSTSDATVGDMNTSGALKWSRARPYSEANACLLYRDTTDKTSMWLGDNAYTRLPVLAKLTYIYSTRRALPRDANKQLIIYPPGKQEYTAQIVYTPVYSYWNPYNVELRIPDNTLGCLSSTYQVMPMRAELHLAGIPQANGPQNFATNNAHSFLRSGGDSEIIFKPGEIRIFSHPAITDETLSQDKPLDLVPGFNPLAYGGDVKSFGNHLPSQNIGIILQFSHSYGSGNVVYGSTPGSLCHTPFWLPSGAARNTGFQWNIPVMYQNDWFNLAQTYTPITLTDSLNMPKWDLGSDGLFPFAYTQLVIKGSSNFDYETIDWESDWRCRNWIQAPPFYFGSATYMSETPEIAHTQRLDCPYIMNFGVAGSSEIPKIVGQSGVRGIFGSGSNPFERVSSVSAIELPTAPLSSLAGFSGMRINPGWANPSAMNPELTVNNKPGGNDTRRASYYYGLAKTQAYQSGVTGPGLGNSFMHPMLTRTGVYQFYENSISQDPADRTLPFTNINKNNNLVFSDYWDHAFLLNDALWDDYFVSSLADQTRPPVTNPSSSLNSNIGRLIAGEKISNSRYRFHSGGQVPATIKAKLLEPEGYLKTAKHLVVDGVFNVNSTSEAAWFSIFAGIRERQLVYRDNSGTLANIAIPTGKRIAISRFDTEVSDKEMDEIDTGVTMPDGSQGWSGVRFLDDTQLQNLAKQCVKQVKLRGPFLNFSEFINRRLSNDQLGLLGALQSAIDYDDASPNSASLNFIYKNGNNFMLKTADLGGAQFQTPEAAEGSRFAGIPGYVIQSDLLKPIANTLAVRDDTFRIRAYGETRDGSNKVIARAWCEAVVQRVPEYFDSTANDPEIPARLLDTTNGTFSDNPNLKPINVRFGRKFQIESFRWLNASEV